MAEKNAPATGGLNCRVTSTVTPIEVTAETAAPMRFRVLPRETSASFPPPLLLAGQARPDWLALGSRRGRARPTGAPQERTEPSADGARGLR